MKFRCDAAAGVGDRNEHGIGRLSMALAAVFDRSGLGDAALPEMRLGDQINSAIAGRMF